MTRAAGWASASVGRGYGTVARQLVAVAWDCLLVHCLWKNHADAGAQTSELIGAIEYVMPGNVLVGHRHELPFSQVLE